MLLIVGVDGHKGCDGRGNRDDNQFTLLNPMACLLGLLERLDTHQVAQSDPMRGGGASAFDPLRTASGASGTEDPQETRWRGVAVLTGFRAILGPDGLFVGSNKSSSLDMLEQSWRLFTFQDNRPKLEIRRKADSVTFDTLFPSLESLSVATLSFKTEHGNSFVPENVQKPNKGTCWALAADFKNPNKGLDSEQKHTQSMFPFKLLSL